MKTQQRSIKHTQFEAWDSGLLLRKSCGAVIFREEKVLLQNRAVQQQILNLSGIQNGHGYEASPVVIDHGGRIAEAKVFKVSGNIVIRYRKLRVLGNCLEDQAQLRGLIQALLVGIHSLLNRAGTGHIRQVGLQIQTVLMSCCLVLISQRVRLEI